MKKGKGRRRLAVLIQFMDGLPRKANKHFNMGTFFSHYGDKLHPDSGGALTYKGMLDCGTSACALGWATVCPSLRRQGLSMKIFHDESRGWLWKFRISGRRVLSAFDAAERFFGLNQFESRELFATDAATPKAWARKARKLLATMES